MNIIQRGAAFLLRTQNKDGSWYAKSRAMKIQPYFESGFPYGHDQWISQTATSWATIGLSLTAQEPPAVATSISWEDTLASLWAWRATNRFPVISAWLSSLRVTRVSSHAMTSADRRASTGPFPAAALAARAIRA